MCEAETTKEALGGMPPFAGGKTQTQMEDMSSQGMAFGSSPRAVPSAPGRPCQSPSCLRGSRPRPRTSLEKWVPLFPGYHGLPAFAAGCPQQIPKPPPAQSARFSWALTPIYPCEELLPLLGKCWQGHPSVCFHLEWPNNHFW